MKTTPSMLSLFLLLLSYSGWTNGLCSLENGTMARCYELEDVKYIETYDLESLKASVQERVLHPGFFSNLSSLRHLDLSGGNLERIKPGSFHKLVNLRSLSLAGNNIGFLDLGSIDGLNHLHSLNLQRNNLRQLPPALARLTVLKHLDVQGNPLECNCATLKVRDLISKRGVKISKKILCAGPSNVKGTPLFKPDATIVCNFEEQDREMQRDQGYESSDYGSGDDLEDYKEDGEEGVPVEIGDLQEEDMKVETPAPDPLGVSTTSATQATASDTGTSSSAEGSISSTEVTDSIEGAVDKSSSLDIDEGRELTSTAAAVARRKEFEDALYNPVEGSGHEDGSGEGSGTGAVRGASQDTNDTEDEALPFGNQIFSDIVGIFIGTTEATETKKDLDLVAEEFINASSTKEIGVPKKSDVEETTASATDVTTKGTTMIPTGPVKLVNSELQDNDEDGLSPAPAKQSKKGMGSYVVLAALLAILATLIGFAAYKGDFCKKKRKRGDVEKGTEMKDMQKALLDTGNSTQPKIASNGIVESAPLVVDAVDHEDRKACNDNLSSEAPKSQNGTAERVDPVKPPRRTATPDDRRSNETTGHDTSSVKDGSLSGRRSFEDPVTNNGPTGQMSEVNGPPLSPGAQRVKITLQENPDSVPRTPILITRTMAGENLVNNKPRNTEE